MGDRFTAEVLGNPKSFTQRNIDPLIAESNDLLASLRASTPDASGPTTPSTRSLRRPSVQIAAQQARQTYWNEYDDGSDAENEPYAIYIDPNADTTFPGSKAFSQIYSTVKAPMSKFRGWLSPSTSPTEQRPLLRNGNGNGNGRPSNNTSPGGYFTETDMEDEAYASSTEFPVGYATHYATLPSVRDQRYSRSRQQLLFRGTIASFVASGVLFLIASMLVATGKHKLRVEVDVGAIIGVVSSLFFATLGLGTMMYTSPSLGWTYKSCISVLFIAMCLLNGMLLVMVVGNSAL